MASPMRVRLIDVDPDLVALVSDEQKAALRNLTVPVIEISDEQFQLDELLEQCEAFAAILLEGVIAQRITLGRHSSMRLLGPSEILSRSLKGRFSTLVSCSYVLAGTARMALLRAELLAEVQRWPVIIEGLYRRIAESRDRVVGQVAICQLPRVTDRLLAMMWLLAESWGKVTPGGVTLPLTLTHEALGELVGARRSTVTLAIGELIDRGSILRRDTGWMLLDRVGADADGKSPAYVPEIVAGTSPELGLITATAPSAPAAPALRRAQSGGGGRALSS